MNLDQELVSITDTEAIEQRADSSQVKATSDLSDGQAQALALSVSFATVQQFPWLGPLLEAALTCPPDKRRPVQIFTRWGGFPPEAVGPSDADPAKHALYRNHFISVLEQAAPWLIPLLNSCQATLLVHPGECRYTVLPDPSLNRPACAFEIPQLIPFTHLTPFPPEDGEIVH